MVTKFQQYNESISSLLVGPTKEEVWNDLMDGKLKGFINHIPDSHEDFFNQMMKDCVKTKRDKYYSYWGKNDTTLFWVEPKFNKLYVNGKYIWTILENVYGFNYIETQSLLLDILKNTKWKGLGVYKYLW